MEDFSFFYFFFLNHKKNFFSFFAFLSTYQPVICLVDIIEISYRRFGNNPQLLDYQKNL